MTDRWVRVFEGLVPEARIVEGLLQERGVPATVVATRPGFLEAASMGTATSFESVLVPPERAEDALAILRDVRSGSDDEVDGAP